MTLVIQWQPNRARLDFLIFKSRTWPHSVRKVKSNWDNFKPKRKSRKLKTILRLCNSSYNKRTWDRCNTLSNTTLFKRRWCSINSNNSKCTWGNIWSDSKWWWIRWQCNAAINTWCKPLLLEPDHNMDKSPPWTPDPWCSNSKWCVSKCMPNSNKERQWCSNNNLHSNKWECRPCKDNRLLVSRCNPKWPHIKLNNRQCFSRDSRQCRCITRLWWDSVSRCRCKWADLWCRDSPWCNLNRWCSPICSLSKDDDCNQIRWWI